MFSTFDVSLSVKTVKYAIFTRVELLGNRIFIQIKGTKRTLIFDDWTHNYTHYVGMFLSYCKNSSDKMVPFLTLIAVSPMSQTPKYDNENDELCKDIKDSNDVEKISFNAETHINFFNYSFEMFGRPIFTTLCCLTWR